MEASSNATQALITRSQTTKQGEEKNVNDERKTADTKAQKKDISDVGALSFIK